MRLTGHLLAALFMPLTLAFPSFAQKGPTFQALKDAYPDRNLILNHSFGLCADLFAIPEISRAAIIRVLPKYFLKDINVTRLDSDASGWTVDMSVQERPGGFLRLMKIGTNFVFSYRQSESTIEGIADITLEADCLKLSEARFVYHNKSLRPIQRIRINSLYQQVQSVTMEEPVRQLKSSRTQALEKTRIGIIDTGIDYNHPVLLDKSRPMLGIDLTNKDRPPYDYTNTVQNELMGRYFSHGTAVADIASRNADVLIVPVRTNNQTTLNGAAIEYLAQKQVRIVNVSQGTARKEEWLSFKDAVERHPEILFIVSSGNNAKNLDLDPVYPSTFELPNLIVVASINQEGLLSSFSNYSSKFVHFAAIGEKVTAALAGGGDWIVSGTSFSAPLVARIAAKLLAENPSCSTQDLKSLLIQKAKSSPELQGKVQYGILKDE